MANIRILATAVAVLLTASYSSTLAQQVTQDFESGDRNIERENCWFFGGAITVRSGTPAINGNHAAGTNRMSDTELRLLISPWIKFSGPSVVSFTHRKYDPGNCDLTLLIQSKETLVSTELVTYGKYVDDGAIATFSETENLPTITGKVYRLIWKITPAGGDRPRVAIDDILISSAEHYADRNSYRHPNNNEQHPLKSETNNMLCDCLSAGPIANNDAVQLDEDAVGFPINPLSNDTDPDGDLDPDRVTIIAAAAHGTATITNGTISYTPEPNFFGEDVVTYVAYDQYPYGPPVRTSQAEVRITVQPVNDIPIAEDDSFTASSGSTHEIDILANDNDDADNATDQLEIDPNGFSSPDQGGSVAVVGGKIAYTSADGFVGTETFTYTIVDEDGATNTATVSVTVSGTAETHQPTVSNGGVATEEDQTVAFAETDFSNNYNDPKDSALTKIMITKLPENGTLLINGDTIRVNAEIDAANLDQLTFVPAPNYHGEASFIWKGHNGTRYSAQEATMVLTVAPVNDRPVAEDSQMSTTGSTPAGESLLPYASDLEGDQLMLSTTPVTEPQHGTVVINSDGSYSYQADAGFAGMDSFTYEVCDDGEPSACGQATVTVTVVQEPLEISEGFSPNGDGNNETWYIRGIEHYPNNEVAVYNRWGNVVYQTKGYNNQNKRWGGIGRGMTVGSGKLPYGVYYYLVELGDGSAPRKGYLVISQ